jgi:hypothetical protein
MNRLQIHLLVNSEVAEGQVDESSDDVDDEDSLAVELDGLLDGARLCRRYRRLVRRTGDNVIKLFFSSSSLMLRAIDFQA